MAKYFKLKDQKSSGGATVDGIFYNNATVSKYEGEAPKSVVIQVRSNVLTEATEQEYNKYVAQQAEAQANREKKFAAKIEAKKEKGLKTGKIGEIVIVEAELKKEEAETEKEEASKEENEGGENNENGGGNEGGEAEKTETDNKGKKTKK